MLYSCSETNQTANGSLGQKNKNKSEQNEMKSGI